MGSGRPMTLVLLLACVVFAIVSSSKSEQQHQQHPGSSAISEVTASNDTRPSLPSSEVGGSSEEADDDNEDEEEDDGTDNDQEDGEDEDEEEEEGGDETSAEMDDDDEYEDELRAAADKVKPTELSQPSDALSSELLRLNDDKEVSELLQFKRRKKSKDKREPSVKKELESQNPEANNNHTQESNHAEDPRTELQAEEESYEEGGERHGQQQRLEFTRYDNINYPGYTVTRSELMRRLDKRQAELVRDIKSYLLDQYGDQERLQELGEEKGLYAESLLKLLSKLSENPQRWERVHQLLNDLRADLDYSRQALEIQKRLVQGSNPSGMPTLTTTRPDRTTRRPKWKKKKKKKKKPRQHKPKTSATTTTTPAIPTVMGLATTETPVPRWRLVAERLFNPPWDQNDSSIAKVRYSMPSKPRTIINSMRRPLDDDDGDKEQLSPNRDDGLEALNSERQALMLEAAREYSQPRPMHYGKINTHQRTTDEDEGAYQRPMHFGQLIPSTSSRMAYPRVRNPFDSSLARNQEFLSAGREFVPSKTWRNGYRQIPKNSWNWEQPKSWVPLNPERDYFEEPDEDDRAWQRQKQWRQNLREKLPPWLEEKEIQRVLEASSSWAQPEKSREENSGNNNSEFKQETDSKESPKLTMKTWDSLTSDPATWPFKLPGAKPWPKDENGQSYNPNADLVRKLGLYSKNARPQDKQHKSQKHEKPSSSWLEPDEQQSAWFNSLKHWNNEPSSGRTEEKNDWNLSKTSNKWNKQFAYHKVTAQPTSKSKLDKSGGRNAFIAVSAVSEPKYGNDWMKNDIEEVGREEGGADPDHPSSQMRMNMWKKNTGINGTIVRNDVLENQLERLKENNGPVLLEVNISIKNATTHLNPESSTPSIEKMTEKYNVTQDKEKLHSKLN